jgi:hypothetical protein
MNFIEKRILNYIINKEIKRYPDCVGKLRKTQHGSFYEDCQAWEVSDDIYITRNIDKYTKQSKEHIQEKINLEKSKLEQLEKSKNNKR